MALERHTALEAFLHLLDVFLVVLQAAQLALVHDHVIAQQADLSVTLHLAVGDVRTSDDARTGDLHDRTHLGVAQDDLLVLGGEQTLHGQLHVLDGLVDDGVQAHIDLFALGGLTGGGVGADVEADDDGVEGAGQVDVVLGDGAGSGVQHAHADFVVGELLHGLLDGLDGALHVCLDDQVQRGLLAGLQVGEQALHAHLGHGSLAGSLQLGLALLGDLTGQVIVTNGDHLITRGGHLVEAHDLHRHGGAGFLDLLAAVVDQRTHTAGGHAGDDVVAHAQGTILQQHGGQRTTGLVQLRLDDNAAAQTVGVGAQLHGFGLQEDHLQQLVDALAGMGGNRHHDDVAAPVFADDAVVGQVLLDALGVGGGLIHLGHSHDHGHFSSLGVVDGLNGLGHDGVVRRHDQDGDIGGLGAAGTHGSEGLVTGGIQEGDLTLLVHLDGVGADVLGDAAGLASSDAALADVVQQGGLAVVDVTHDGDDGGTGHQVVVGILEVLSDQLILSGLLSLLLQGDFEVRAHQGSGIEVDLGVDGGHVAQQEQLLDDLAGGLADLLAQVAHDDRIAGHVGSLDLDGCHHLLCRGLLLAGLLAAADHVIIITGVAGITGELLAVAGNMLRIVLTDVVLLVGIVVGDALLAHGGSHLGSCGLGTAHAAAHGTTLTGSTLGTTLEAALTGSCCRTALEAAGATLGTALEALTLRTGLETTLTGSTLGTGLESTVGTGTALEALTLGTGLEITLASLLGTGLEVALALGTRLEIALALRTGLESTVGGGTALLLRRLTLRSLSGLGRTGLHRTGRTDHIGRQAHGLLGHILTRAADDLTDSRLLGSLSGSLLGSSLFDGSLLSSGLLSGSLLSSGLLGSSLLSGSLLSSGLLGGSLLSSSLRGSCLLGGGLFGSGLGAGSFLLGSLNGCTLFSVQHDIRLGMIRALLLSLGTLHLGVLFFVGLHKAIFNRTQGLEQILRTLARTGRIILHLGGVRQELFGSILQFQFRHSTLAPPL